MTPEIGALYFGRVVHRRLKPVTHRLAYKVFAMLIDLDRVDAASSSMRWFSRNRFNLFSFHDRDFGDGGRDPAGAARRLGREAGVDASGRVMLLFYPRMLGYAFNPLAVYYLHDAAGAVTGIIYEVRNTFGGKHSYVIAARPGDGGTIHQQADKRFHVSPFMEMTARYHFRLRPPADEVLVAIRQTDEDGPLLNAIFAGEKGALSDAALLSAFRRYPMMTLKIIAAIHWEALRLVAKGLRLRKGAPDPEPPVTVLRTPARQGASLNEGAAGASR